MKFRIAQKIALGVAHASDAGANGGYYDPRLASSGRKLADGSSGSNDRAKVLHQQPDRIVLLAGNCDPSEAVNGSTRLHPKVRATRLRDHGSHSVAANKTDGGKAIAVGNGGLMIAGASTNAAGNDTQFGIARLIVDTLFENGFEG